MLNSAVFITFSGNCEKALSFYQTCFGGLLQFETFEKEINGYTERPVVIGSLVSGGITIHGSDLVTDEGRKIGNHIAIFLYCKDKDDRSALIKKLQFEKELPVNNNHDQKLIEITDAFEVRWILSVNPH